MPLLSIAQKENNIWYFGDRVGLDFTNGNPVSLSNSAMYSYEGTATICDASGNLLFYTNGGPLYDSVGAIWNRNHSIMPNGILNTSDGCMSSMHSSIIIPNPGHPLEYYLFTTNCPENFGYQHIGGLQYSKIDMTLDGGLGDVTAKGIPLLDSAAESLYAVKDENGTDYWVIAHKSGNNSFYTYHVTSTGVSLPVISSIGFPVSFGGQITATIDGKRIGYASIYHTSLFDFDNSTGVISNFIDLDKIASGCAFSSNCRFFYVYARDDLWPSPPTVAWDTVYQFNLLSANVSTSGVAIATTVTPVFRRPGAMSLGPDGKIYLFVANQYMDVIKNPNALGSACNYVEDDIFLGNNALTYGMPNVVNSFYGECQFETSVSSLSNLSSAQVVLSPNPFNERTIIELYNLENEKVHLSLINCFGQVIRSINNIKDSKIIFERDNLPSGVYFFQLRTDKSIVQTGKFIIQ